MARFEYDTFVKVWGYGDETDDIKAELNRRGAEGWELVGVVRDESSEDRADEESILFIMKRSS